MTQRAPHSDETLDVGYYETLLSGKMSYSHLVSFVLFVNVNKYLKQLVLGDKLKGIFKFYFVFLSS